MPDKNDQERLVTAEMAAYGVLRKLHQHTECGRGGMHWAECDRLVEAFGWRSWEDWNAVVEHVVLR